jgi:thiamine biosynthesis lipoprotein
MTTTFPARSPETFAGSLHAIGTEIRILTTDPACLAPATTMARDYLAALDLAASRFRADSEISRLARHSGGWVAVSPLLVDHLRAALHAARITDGLVDPTVGAAVAASGYDADLDLVRSRREPVEARPAHVPGWRTIELDETGGLVRTAPGTVVDLGATAKAHAADHLAESMAARLPGGFLVDLGGDIAVAGTLPAGGWRVGVESATGEVVQVVSSTGQALATSSTRLRAWRTSEGLAHHVVDPRTGRTARAVHAQVTCAGINALEANAASTAALVLGDEAREWLAGHGIPARLDRLDGSVETTPGWPEPSRSHGR